MFANHYKGQVNKKTPADHFYESLEELFKRYGQRGEDHRSSVAFVKLIHNSISNELSVDVICAGVQQFSKAQLAGLKTNGSEESALQPFKDYIAMIDRFDWHDFLRKRKLYMAIKKLNDHRDAEMALEPLSNTALNFPLYINAVFTQIFMYIKPQDGLLTAKQKEQFFAIFKNVHHDLLQVFEKGALLTQDQQQTYKDSLLFMIQEGIKVEAASKDQKEQDNLERVGFFILKQLTEELPVSVLMAYSFDVIRESFIVLAAKQAYISCYRESQLNKPCEPVFESLDGVLSLMLDLCNFHKNPVLVGENDDLGLELEGVMSLWQADQWGLQNRKKDYCESLPRVGTTFSLLAEKASRIISKINDLASKNNFILNLLFIFSSGKLVERVYEVFLQGMELAAKEGAVESEDTPERLEMVIQSLSVSSGLRLGIKTYALAAAFSLHLSCLVEACGAKKTMDDEDFARLNLRKRLDHLLARWQSLYPQNTQKSQSTSTATLCGVRTAGRDIKENDGNVKHAESSLST